MANGNMPRFRKGPLLFLSLAIVLTCGVYFYVQNSHKDRTSTSGVSFSKVISHTKGANNSATHHCVLYRERLKHYCHQTLLEGTTTEYAEEGKLSEKREEKLELIHAHVVARHGDRTPAIKISNLGHPEVAYQCSLDVKLLSPNWGQERDLWLGLSDFPPLSPVGNVRNAKLKLHSGSPDEPCKVGDLTSLGYLQHLNLGYLMQSRYANLFPGLEIKDQVYVQSTDYRRTIRSAGAFLLGFIPDGRRLREMVTIHIQPGNLNQVPPVGIPWTYKPCNNLEKLRAVENQHSGYYATEKRSHWMQDRVIDMFKLKVQTKTTWTEIFDHFLTRGCHSLHKDTVLPCTKDKKCINCGLGRKMFDFADWSMMGKYPTNSSLLACLPFLKHSLVDTMAAAVSNPHTTRYKIMLTFTHDSTLNRLFKSLGLSVGELIPYASRLAFEVWRTTNDDAEGARHFVRVLFNGKTVTQELPFSNGSELVPFTKWKDSVLQLNLWAYRKVCSI